MRAWISPAVVYAGGTVSDHGAAACHAVVLVPAVPIHCRRQCHGERGVPERCHSIEGEPRDYRSIADSGNVMHRRFCPHCGTHLFSASEARPHLIIVRNGALDDTALARPGATIWTTAAPEWAWIDETLPMHDGQPPPVA
jgi:hypothetical protein